MTIPKYNDLFSNVLSLFSDETEEYKTRHIKQIVSDLLDLSPEERNFLKEGTNEPLIEYRLGWTLTYLKKAGLLESKRRGYVNITKLGLNEIKENPNISEKDLYKFPSFIEFKQKNVKSNDENQTKLKNQYSSFNHEEEIVQLINHFNLNIFDKLNKNILNSNFNVFKKIIIDLLLKLGYHQFKLIEKNNLNEFYGLINQDSLGLDQIAIHAINKFDKINISELQSFAGFIVSKGLTKGIFISTSSFNNNIFEYVENEINLNIILIDGKKLVELMVEKNIGISRINVELQNINDDYFKLDKT